MKVFFCTEATCDRPATAKQIELVRMQLESNPQVKSASLRLQGRGARAHAQAEPGARARPHLQPAPRRVRGPAGQGRVHREIAQSIEPAGGAAAKPPGVEKVTYGEKTANRILKVARVIEALLPARRGDPARRVDAADREHDPALDLLSAARDRGDEARRRDELVRARSVHDRGPALRARRLRLRGAAAPARQGDRAAGDPRPHRRRRRRPRARVRRERPARDRRSACCSAPWAPASRSAASSASDARRRRARRSAASSSSASRTSRPGTPILLDRQGLDDARARRPRRRPARRPGPRPPRARARAREPDRDRARGAARRARRARPSSSRTTLPEPSLEGRVDLRELPTFTIDPETAKDFDDAISVEPDGDGLRAWVHIADVSYFVPAGSPLDRGAVRARASRPTCRASSRRCSRTSSPTTSARSGRTRIGSA